MKNKRIERKKWQIYCKGLKKTGKTIKKRQVFRLSRNHDAILMDETIKGEGQTGQSNGWETYPTKQNVLPKLA